ncbi:MAG: hypothetical protein ACU833_14145 [Gammaproteobacteria bacterium]
MNKTKLIHSLGGAVAVSLLTAPAIQAAENPFAMQKIANPTYLAEAGKGAEGKCGEGKCSGKMQEGGCSGAKDKMKEGKCGEGKCGGKMKEGGCSGSMSDSDNAE